MNAIKENTVVFPKMKADQSGVLKVRYSNSGNNSYGPSMDGYEDLYALGSSSGTSSSSSSGSNALGWVDTISGMFGKIGDIANGIFGNVNQSKYGTDSYNQARIAEANAQAAANAKQKNTGLWIALVVLALLMVVGFALVITKKRK